MRYAFSVGGQTHKLTLEENADGAKFRLGDTVHEPKVKVDKNGTYSVEVDGEKFQFKVHNGHIHDDDGIIDLHIGRARPELVRKGGKGRKTDGRIKPPMPGKIVEVTVAVGAVVAAGDVVVVLEAMKMQNDLKSPIAGTVSKVHVKPGANVEATTILVEIEPEAVDA